MRRFGHRRRNKLLCRRPPASAPYRFRRTLPVFAFGSALIPRRTGMVPKQKAPAVPPQKTAPVQRKTVVFLALLRQLLRKLGRKDFFRAGFRRKGVPLTQSRLRRPFRRRGTGGIRRQRRKILIAAAAKSQQQHTAQNQRRQAAKRTFRHLSFTSFHHMPQKNRPIAPGIRKNRRSLSPQTPPGCSSPKHQPAGRLPQCG